MADIKTIKIKDGDGFIIINEGDYNPEIHEKFDVIKKRTVLEVPKKVPLPNESEVKIIN
jgi:hypothetical protein